MAEWRAHKDDGFCDAAHCHSQYEETHISHARLYAACSKHIEAAITAASADNKRWKDEQDTRCPES